MLKILIADDHSIIRLGIKYLLKNNFENVKINEAANGEEVIDYIKANGVDVLIMDLNMPDTDAQGLLRAVLTHKPDTGVIIFSMHKEEIFGSIYFNLGAMAYLSKGCDDMEIVKAVRCVSEGHIYITKKMQPYYLGGSSFASGKGPFSLLSRKEVEVLRHLSKGQSVTNIGKVMNIGSSTVGTHKASIFQKLGVGNMFELKSLIDLNPL